MVTLYNKKPYSKKDLLYFISQAVFECGWNLIYLNNEHPFKVKIFTENESYFIKIIIYNISHGGGKKRAANEYRIQIKEPLLEHDTAYKTLILGYYRDLGVFAGFDISKHLGKPGYSSSLQIRAENLEQSAINGFSPCDKGNGEIAIAFRPDFFVEYVSNLETLHTFGQSEYEFSVLEGFAASSILPNDEIMKKISQPRQKTLQYISKKQRDSSFKARILRAYNYRCAFSGIQLKLVDAAHIIPVSFDTSTDETCNGIALSAIHHRAYDKGLITFNEKYQIIFKENEVKKLQDLNLHGGWEKFVTDLRPIIDLPPAISDRPNIHYITTANQLRGW
jgi:putative restriction endonuclease